MKNLKLVKMSGVKTEQVEWIINGRIPVGKITVIQGDPGCGKTTFALAIAAALTSGAELPCGTRHAPADVIFQSSEDGYGDTIKPRLEMFGADCSCVSYIDDSEEALSFSDERIEAAINEVGAKMLVCDPAQSFYSHIP